MISQILRMAVVLLAAGWTFGAQTAPAVSAEGRYEVPRNMSRELQPVGQHFKVADALEPSHRQRRAKFHELALERLLVTARAGDAEAQYLVGRMYCSGQGLARRNENNCVSWLRKAANQKHAKARELLSIKRAKCEKRLRLVSINKLRAAAGKGSEREAEALEQKLPDECGLILAELLRHGRIDDKIEIEIAERAVETLKKNLRAEAANLEKKSDALAKKEAQLEAEVSELEKNLEKQTEAARVAAINLKGVEALHAKNFPEARQAFDEACKGGSHASCYYLGSFMLRGLGGKKLHGEARKWFAVACDGGELRGCHDLAVMHAFGAGGPRDVDAAKSLATKACEGGQAEACDLQKKLQ